MKRFRVVPGHNRTSSGTRVSKFGEAKFHLARDGFAELHATHFAKAVCLCGIVELRRVMGIGADRFPSFCIEKHRSKRWAC